MAQSPDVSMKFQSQYVHICFIGSFRQPKECIHKSTMDVFHDKNI